jgi:hypothetical protein
MSAPDGSRPEGWWALNWGLFTVPMLASMVTVVLFYIFRYLCIAIQGDLVSRLFPGKLTMLSFLLAAAFIQYQYFFQMRWKDGQKIRAGDWPALERAKRLLEEGRKTERQDPAFKEWEASLERFVDPETYLKAMAAQNRPIFRRAHSLIFAIVASCFLSATADLAWLLLLPHDVVTLRE